MVGSRFDLLQKNIVADNMETNADKVAVEEILAENTQVREIPFIPQQEIPNTDMIATDPTKIGVNLGSENDIIMSISPSEILTDITSTINEDSKVSAKIPPENWAINLRNSNTNQIGQPLSFHVRRRPNATEIARNTFENLRTLNSSKENSQPNNLPNESHISKPPLKPSQATHCLFYPAPRSLDSSHPYPCLFHSTLESRSHFIPWCPHNW